MTQISPVASFPNEIVYWSIREKQKYEKSDVGHYAN